MHQPQLLGQKGRSWPFRDRVFVVLTVYMAAACVWATEHFSQEYVLTPNAARGLMTILMPSGFGPPPTATGPEELAASNGLSDPAGPSPFVGPRRVMEQVAAVEVIVYVWRRVMWGVAGFLAAVAMLAALTCRSRVLHLTAAGVILLSTVATLVAMRLLIDPDYGGMRDLPIRSHVVVAAAQSAYGLVLIVAFAGKRNAP